MKGEGELYYGQRMKLKWVELTVRGGGEYFEKKT